MIPLQVRESSSAARDQSVPLFSSGFRSFFLSATLAALLLVPAWLLVLSYGSVTPYWSPLRWHSHEMLFGYTGAVIVGFLLTAGSNWTKIKVATGSTLVGLNLLWLLGRVLPLTPGIPPALVLVVDLSFFPAVAFFLSRAMLRSKNRRNYFFVVLLLLLTGANALYHLEQWGVLAPSVLGRNLALRVIALIILIVGARIIPMFTRNATSAKWIRSVPWLDRAATAIVVLAALYEAFALEPQLLAGMWLLAGFANIARMLWWGSRHARAPLLWILHAGYLATALSLVLEGFFLLGVVPYATSLHCFTVGGIGLLTLGMMARVSLGHTGRMLVAPKSVSLAFVLLTLAALVRVFTPVLAPAHLFLSWYLAGALWALAFGIFLHFGLRIWISPRVD